MAFILNYYSTLTSLPEKDFPHQLLGEWDVSDPEMADHLQGFTGYVASLGKPEMTQIKYHLIRHIQRTRFNTSVSVEDVNIPAFWATDANAILFTQDGFIRDSLGNVLIGPDGAAPLPGVTIPYPEDAQERKKRSTEQFAAAGVHLPASLPPVLGEDEVIFRSIPEIVARMGALLVVILQAESFATGKGSNAAALRERFPGVWAHLSPREAAFMADPAPGQQQITDFMWRYEALNLLAASVGVVGNLEYSSQLCNVPALVDGVTNLCSGGPAATPDLRPHHELLDWLDHHYRLHWAVRQARVKNTPPPGEVDAGVVQERHYALNWLTGFESVGVEWDQIDTPT